MAQDRNVFSHTMGDGSVRVCMLSNAPRIFSPGAAPGEPIVDLAGFDEAIRFASGLEILPEQTRLLRAASGDGSPGFRDIVTWEVTKHQGWTAADGILLRERGVMACFQTADCLAVVFYHRTSDESLLVHFGRPAGKPSYGLNIITTALNIIAPNKDYESVEVCAGGGICGDCFPNKHGNGRREADLYLESFGPSVFTDVDTRSLDLQAVLRMQCQAVGIEPTFFGADCTLEAPCCASHRQLGTKRTVANTFMLAKVP